MTNLEIFKGVVRLSMITGLIYILVVVINSLSKTNQSLIINKVNTNEVKIIKLEKQNDSLKIMIHQRDLSIVRKDSLISALNFRQKLLDILIIKNNNNLKDDKIKIKKLTYDTRYKYVDSILRCAGVRK